MCRSVTDDPHGFKRVLSRTRRFCISGRIVPWLWCLCVVAFGTKSVFKKGIMPLNCCSNFWAWAFRDWKDATNYSLGSPVFLCQVLLYPLSRIQKSKLPAHLCATCLVFLFFYPQLGPVSDNFQCTGTGRFVICCRRIHIFYIKSTNLPCFYNRG